MTNWDFIEFKIVFKWTNIVQYVQFMIQMGWKIELSPYIFFVTKGQILVLWKGIDFASILQLQHLWK